MGSQRIVIRKIIPHEQPKIGHRDSNHASRFQNAKALSRNLQGFLISEVFEGVGRIDIPDTRLVEGKALSHVVAANVPWPPRKLQQAINQRDSRQRNGQRIVKVIPAIESRYSAPDIDLDFILQFFAHRIGK